MVMFESTTASGSVFEYALEEKSGKHRNNRVTNKFNNGTNLLGVLLGMSASFALMPSPLTRDALRSTFGLILDMAEPSLATAAAPNAAPAQRVLQ